MTTSRRRFIPVAVREPRPRLRAFREDGTEVQPGETVTDFRGDTATFQRATRAPEPGRSGKVVVGDDPFHGAEYYDRVFKLTIRADPPATAN